MNSELWVLATLILGSTFIPFVASWCLKKKCPNRFISFRFISRKWLITVIPCAIIVYLVVSKSTHLNDNLILYLIIWAALCSSIFMLGDHLSQIIKAMIAIKYKDIEICMNPEVGKVQINDTQTKGNDTTTGVVFASNSTASN